MGGKKQYCGNEITPIPTVKECGDLLKKIDLEDDKTVPVKALIGFDKVCKDFKTKVEKMERQKKIASFHILAQEQIDGVNKFSGGVVGDYGLLFEGIVVMCQQRNEIMKIVVEAVKFMQQAEYLKILDIKELKEKKLIGSKLFNVLVNAGIKTLVEFRYKTKKEVEDYRGMGVVTMEELQELLKYRDINFK